MEFVMQNRNDRPYEDALNSLIGEVFGFSFAPWHALGLWDERYESHSVWEGGRMLANVCVLKARLLVGGREREALQLGAVATRPEARGRGLSRLLMERIAALYPSRPAYLTANAGVVGFYPRFGFRRAVSYRPYITYINKHIENSSHLPVTLSQDDGEVLRLLGARALPSALLDCLNVQPVKRFHLLLDYPDAIYRLPCGAVAVAEQRGETLFLADLLADFPVTFEAIARELPFSGVKRVEFGFCPDRLGVDPSWEREESEDEALFLRGDWSDLPEYFRFPALSVT